MDVITYIALGVAIVSFSLYFWMRFHRVELTGFFGERTVSKRYLSKLPAEYHVINNLLIPNRSGTSQIDHVIVSPYGIFVIETKRYSGLIRGSWRSKQWRQYFGSRYQLFHNPIHQNYGHIQALKAILPNVSDDKFVSIIVFLMSARLNVQVSEGGNVHVVNSMGVLQTIRSYADIVFTKDEVSSIVEEIQKHNTQSRKNLKSHIESIKNDTGQ